MRIVVIDLLSSQIVARSRFGRLKLSVTESVWIFNSVPLLIFTVDSRVPVPGTRYTILYCIVRVPGFTGITVITG